MGRVQNQETCRMDHADARPPSLLSAATLAQPSSDDGSPTNFTSTPIRRWGCAWGTTVSQ
eukprot:3020063-Alexandrium_andersonii.AAC.1